MSAVWRRSKLFCPGNRPDLMAKAARSGADMVVLDLEDAVGPADKAQAREEVRAALGRLDFGEKERGVRINGLQTPFWMDDLLAVFGDGLDAVHIPKVSSPREVWVVEAVLADLERKAGRTRPVRIIPTLETPEGVEQADEIAACSPRVAALQFGLADLTAGLGLVPAPHRLAPFRTRLAVAAHRTGIVALDTAYLNVRDPDGFRADAAEARACGMRGKSCIHPAQVAIANEVFSPTEAEVARARAVLAAYEEGLRHGRGAIALQGWMIDRPVAEQARQVLAMAAEMGLTDRDETGESTHSGAGKETR